MSESIEQILIKKIHALSAEQQQKMLEYAKNLEVAESNRHRPIWEVINEISSQIPLEEWEKIPNDASVNLDHYLYGAPKQTK